MNHVPENRNAQALGRTKKSKAYRGWLIACLVLITAWLGYVTSNIVAPAQTEPSDNIDAVISLAPQYDRLVTAQQIYDQSGAGHLVVSYFPGDRYLAVPSTAEEDIELVADYCADIDPAYITCATPDYATTLGEAAMINRIAATGSWTSLTVVTSKYHAFRTRLILDRCLDADLDVDVVFSEVHFNTELWLRYIIYENAAYLKAQLETLFRC